MPAIENSEALRKAINIFGSKERLDEVSKHFYPVVNDLLKRESFAAEEYVSIVLADPICNNEAERLYVCAKMAYHIGTAHAYGRTKI